MSGFGKIYESSNWGVGVCDNTIGWGSSYKSIANCTDASFSYSSDSFAQNGSNPTPTITGDAGGTFTATPSGLSLNASTGEITLSTSTINSYTIRYTLPDTTFAEQTVGIIAAPFSSTQSFSFDGVNDYFDCGNPTDLQFTSDFSISGWFKTSSTASQRILSKDDGTNRSYYIQLNGNSYLRGAVFTSNTQQSNNAGSGLADGNWHNFVFTFENGVGTKLYIDGGTPNLDTVTGALDNDSSIVTIGSRGDGANKFNGNIDEVALWNSTLSSAAVTEIYGTGVPNDLDSLSNASSPTAWYRMGE
jgi:hypothetical protein